MINTFLFIVLTLFASLFLQFLLQLLGILARQYDDELTARFRLLKVSDHLGKASTHTFLVQLRDFTAAAHLSVFSKNLGKLLQGINHSIG